MGHTRIKTIATLLSWDHYNLQDKNRIYPVSPLMLIQTHPKKFPESDKNGNFLTWIGLNNKQLVKHVPPSIATDLVHMDQERKNLQ